MRSALTVEELLVQEVHHLGNLRIYNRTIL